ncbi:pyrroline-5-carboxylate reductase [Nostoc sp. 'Lobaria pulmonaria (5183) cyanobiont']|uniref:pyrroline-5-carboxylate reductase n=1 Tax=Nostoc sp. 'Lobaria pulmonaria (5183) cyanobiont' TaxID=1618022 RepID=UPI000CF331A2|nr:pyrroline-5-carboxylate reductase [Nostoc sp. 'Lobaria pulmonaria (5183) cyanobiont']AVH72432.1 pyrroline-5-carboxylate reductase [Nostoc sp. 'Lobaria pulmonaria (5183) cyanobiont']
MTIKFGLIGGGVMGEALLSRLIARGIYQSSEVIVSEPLSSRLDFLKQQYGVAVTTDNSQVFTEAKEVVFLAVKPQVFSAIAQELAHNIDILNREDTPLIISILAGVPLSQLETAFVQLPVIRAMPNTPATVGAGVTAICLGAYTNAKHHQIAQQVFSAVGEVVEVSEALMDAVTGLSGSGPAYVALMVEALADGGVAAGLPRAIANQLALQTVLGTAKLLQETKIHPAELKDRVTSPGGTTIAGIAKLEQAGFRSALIEAVKAATERSQELGK